MNFSALFPLRWVQQVLQHLPSACFLCAAPAAQGSTLCLWCQQALPGTREPVLEQTENASFPGQAGTFPASPSKRSSYPGHRTGLREQGPDELIAAFSYEYPVNRLIRHLKYGAGLYLAPLLADALVQAIQTRQGAGLEDARVRACATQQHSARASSGPGLPRPQGQPRDLPHKLFAVPLSRRRLRQRGYNQAWEIARRLSQALAIPLGSELVRIRHTPAQAGLNALQRRQNLTQAFALEASSVKGLDIALVDDVYTTGATLEVLAQLLREHGACRVRAWVVARTPAPDF